MARRTKTVTMTGDDRDKGKVFFIREMPPRQSEAWAIQVLSAGARANTTTDPTADIAANGMIEIARIGVRALATMQYVEARPLLDEMLSCVWFVPDVNRIDQGTMLPFVRPVDWDSDVEEMVTVTYLRGEVLEVHTGFSVAAFLSTLAQAAKTAKTSNGAARQTSPRRSRRS